jgi:hypothetical protein
VSRVLVLTGVVLLMVVTFATWYLVNVNSTTPSIVGPLHR